MIFIQVANARVKRVMVDIGSSADVLYFDAFKKLSLTEGDLTPMASTLTRFTGDSISLLGTTVIPITIGEEPRAKTILTTFMVVDLPSTYNVILGRPTLNKLKAVVSTTIEPSSFRPRQESGRSGATRGSQGDAISPRLLSRGNRDRLKPPTPVKDPWHRRYWSLPSDSSRCP